LNCVTATVASLAATLTQFDAALGNALSADIRCASFIGADAGAARELASAAVVDAAARASRTDLGRAGLADIGYAIEPRIAGAIVVAAGELASAAVVDAAAIERAAGLLGAGLTDIGDAK
jgi:hypothetical protein